MMSMQWYQEQKLVEGDNSSRVNVDKIVKAYSRLLLSSPSALSGGLVERHRERLIAPLLFSLAVVYVTHTIQACLLFMRAARCFQTGACTVVTTRAATWSESQGSKLCGPPRCCAISFRLNWQLAGLAKVRGLYACFRATRIWRMFSPGTRLLQGIREQFIILIWYFGHNIMHINILQEGHTPKPHQIQRNTPKFDEWIISSTTKITALYQPN